MLGGYFSVILAGLLSGSPASAGTAHVVQSAVTRQNVYKIVTAEGTETDLKPGLYTLGKKAGPVLLGNVQGVGEDFNGLLTQLKMSRYTGREEAMALVDGRLVLFTNRTTPNAKNSVAVFGENTPVLDGMMMRPFQIAPIQSVDDVRALSYSDTVGGNSELLLVSIRQPNPMGTGLTFAVLVQSESDSSKSSELRLRTPPLIIDYDFLGLEALGRLRSRCEKSDCVLSRSHLMGLTQPLPQDDRILKQWRELLGRLVNEMKGSARGASTILTKTSPAVGGETLFPPRLDLSRATLDFPQFPKQTLATTPLTITQLVDPAGSQTGVFLSRPGTEPSKAQIAGQIAFDKRTGRYRIVDLLAARKKRENESENTNRALVLLKVDRSPWIAFASLRGNVIAAPLSAPTSFADCGKLSGLHEPMAVASTAERTSHLLILSYECNKRERGTLAFQLHETHDGLVQVGQPISLANAYMDPQELRDRFWIGRDGEPLFDSVSETALSQGAAKDAKPDQQAEAAGDLNQGVPTVPFVQLASSLSRGFKQTYLTYRTMQRLDSGLEYREYNPRGARESWTGFYVPRHEDWPDTLRSERDPTVAMHMNGYLLRKPDPDNDRESRPIVINKRLKDETRASAMMTVVPFALQDPDAKSATYFHLQIFLRSDGMATPAVPFMFSLPTRLSFANFSGGQIIQGRRQSANHATLLLFLDGNSNGGVYAIPLTYGKKTGVSGKDVWSMQAEEGAWLKRGDFNPATLKNHIAFDHLGSPYWLDDPELDRFDPKYTVRCIAHEPGTAHYVNRSSFRAVLRYDESLEESEGSFFNSLNRWVVSYVSELTNKYKGLQEYLTDLRKKDKRKSKATETPFPELAAHLDKLADPNAPRETEIMLVEKELKDQIVKEVLWRFTDSEAGRWSIDNNSLAFHDFDPSASPERMQRELDKLGRKPGKRDLLFIDMAKVLETDELDPPLTRKHSAGPAETEVETETARKEEEEEQETEDEDAASEEPQQSLAFRDTVGEIPLGREEEEGEKAKFDFSRMAYVAHQGMPVRLETMSNRHTARFQTLVIATPEEWRREIESFPKEAKAGGFDDFKVNARFLTGSWTVWAPNSSRAGDRVKKLSREPISKDEFSIFSELEKTLNEIADPSGPKRQRILIVPEEVKGYVSNLIMTRWASNSREMNGAWSYKNPNLALFEIASTDSVTQEQIVDNYESMRGAAISRRAALYADMNEIIKMGRPTSQDEDRTFRIRDPILSGQNNASLIERSRDEGSEAEELDRRATPHGIWWLATEGRRVQPKKAKDWSLKSEVTPEIPLLIVATEKEMETLRQVTSFESRFFDVNRHFEITRLEKPSVEAKVALVQDLFSRADMAALGFEFKHEALSNEEARRQLMGLFVGRVDQIARTSRIEPTDAFTRAFVALKRALTEDSELRQTRVIDRFYLERLYNKVFPLALSYDVLRPDDYLHKFRDPNRAARGMTDAGYEGALEPKETNARNISSQTKSVNDNGINVPSSMIIFGDTSSGKTFFVKTTIKYAGLKTYDFDRPGDEEAQAFIVPVQQIAESKEKAKSGQYSIDEILEHLANFLALPKGHRGLILFDDLHKTQSKVVWQKLKTFIETIMDSQDGLITVKRMGDKYSPTKIPVRNLVLRATVNPQDDEVVRRKYVKDTKDLVGEVMAALNKPDYDPIDRSHFARWTDIVDMRNFPRDAKVPTLLKKLRLANEQSFAGKPNVVLVTPRTMDELSAGFEDANAREFISPATYALLEAPANLPKAPIYIVDRQKIPAEVEHRGGMFKRRLQASEVESFVREKTVQYAVRDKNPTSKLHLLSFMVDNFRAQVYSSLVLAGQSAPELADSAELRSSELVSFLLAVLNNIEDFPSVPLKDVIMRPSDFNLHDLEAVATFEEDVKRLSISTPRPFLRVELQGESDDEDLTLDSFLKGRTSTRLARRRVDVMIDTARELEQNMTPVFARYFRVPDLRLHTSPRDWLMTLPEDSGKDALQDLSRELVKAYVRFQAHLYDADLEEMRNSRDYKPMSIYDRARLFLLCVDRALTRLPWGHFTQFMVQTMELASTDLTLSQRTEFQDFLFASKFSPFNTVTPDSVVALAQAVSQVKNLAPERATRFREHFDENCANFLQAGIPEAKKD